MPWLIFERSFVSTMENGISILPTNWLSSQASTTNL